MLVFPVSFPNYIIDFNVQGKHSKTAFKIYAFPNFQFSHFYQEVGQALIVWIRSDEKMKILQIILKIFFFFLFVFIIQCPQIIQGYSEVPPGFPNSTAQQPRQTR